jgi:hypothetical protein
MGPMSYTPNVNDFYSFDNYMLSPFGYYY